MVLGVYKPGVVNQWPRLDVLVGVQLFLAISNNHEETPTKSEALPRVRWWQK